MVQKEVGERFAAQAPARPRTACRRCSPSSPATCASSARSRAASSRRSRTSTPCSSASRATARRRPRACARSCSRASRTAARRSPARSASRPAPTRRIRDRTREALEALGHPADARAESLSPARLAGAVGAPVPLTTLAPGKVNLCLLVGAPRADGLHPLVSVVQPTDLADEVSLEPADFDEVICPGVDGPNLAFRALEEFRFATDWEITGLKLTIAKRIPVAGGHGGRLQRRRRRAAARRAGLRLSRSRPTCRCALGADVTVMIDAERALMTGAGEHVEKLPGAKPPLVVVPLDAAADRRPRSTASSTPTTRRARPRSSRRRRSASATARLRARQRPRARRPPAVPADRPRARGAARKRGRARRW